VRILLICSAFNSLTQRVFVELDDIGHKVGCSVVTDGDEMRAAVDAFDPELVIAPYLKTAIPEDVWARLTCLIVHPGVRGDRGASSLDWAILRGLPTWGVTVLQAAAEFDAGDIWTYREFALGDEPKSAVYRHRVADAAVHAVLEAIVRFDSGTYRPQPLDYGQPDIEGRLERPMKQADRAIDWSASTADVLRRLRCSDSTPGVLDTILGQEYLLFGAHQEEQLRGRPGAILARRDGAICRATGDGAVWISHLRKAPRAGRTFVKLAATEVLARELRGVPELRLAVDEVVLTKTYREIWYEEQGGVGYLHFDFYNGAMNTRQCRRLREAFELARGRPTKVIVLMGGHDLWSNGLDLNVIETAIAPPAEAWANINAIDDLVREILQTGSHLVISALAGNAGAGGVPLALAADEVCACPGVVLNPHYKCMGLFGSEYWTYLLPRRVGLEKALELTETCLPISARRAKSIGLVDHVFGRDVARFRAQVRQMACGLAQGGEIDEWLVAKRAARRREEAKRPLSSYRFVELTRMQRDFAGPQFAAARSAFVHKTPQRPFMHPSADGALIRGKNAYQRRAAA
jgi:putative two-component system hydrogenase maturation factor HypX/HoxX